MEKEKLMTITQEYEALLNKHVAEGDLGILVILTDGEHNSMMSNLNDKEACMLMLSAMCGAQMTILQGDPSKHH